MTDKSEFGFTRVAILAALVSFAVLQGFALIQTGGVFEYPLDDVYIHLAMADGIGAGGYGVNANEYASAASSALYPVLLLPIWPEGMQRYVPLIWNVIGLVMAAGLWGQMLRSAGYGAPQLRRYGIGLAVVGPLAMLMVSAAFAGMEHALHGAASLAIVLGLYCHLQGNPRPILLLAGILFAPLLRFEGLALAVLASGVLLATGARRQGLLAIVFALLPIIGFATFLVSLGLDPLPSSVQAKLVSHGEQGLNLFERAIGTFRINLAKPGGMILTALTVAVWVMLAASQSLRQSKLRLFALVLIGAGLAHMLLGQIGWMDRYEHYILASMSAGFIMLLPTVLAEWKPARMAAVAAVPLVVMLAVYGPGIAKNYPINARAIYTQQQQMSRFAKEFMDTPVAVNDLGWVAWRNPNYVLDLWGLASEESRNKRIFDPTPGWAGPLAEAHNVPVAMIYDDWLGRAVGENWIKVGELNLRERRGYLGSEKVAFYATDVKYLTQVKSAIADWLPTLHPLTFFEYAEGME